MKKQSPGKKLLLFLLLLIMITAATFYFFNSKSPKNLAMEAVSIFYSFEQDGAFSDSWAMFHPLMQEKFPKVDYLQDRPHVFLKHFDVTTFSYTVEEVSEIKSWQMEEGAAPIDLVYQVTVSQVFNGKYGNFTIVQQVFVTELDGEWRILWDYN